MTSAELINSISSKGRIVETKDDDGKVVHRETTGWMSKKQADFLISLMVKEGDEETRFGFAFWCNGVSISRPLNNGARTYNKIERNL